MCGEVATLTNPAWYDRRRQSVVSKKIIDPGFADTLIGLASWLARFPIAFRVIHSNVGPALLLYHGVDGWEGICRAIKVRATISLGPGSIF